MRRCPAASRGRADFKDRSKNGFTANDTILHKTRQRRRRMDGQPNARERGPIGPVSEALLETVQRLTLVAEYRDEEAHSHCRRVRYYTELIVKQMGIPEPDAGIMIFSSPMHDIGKVGIP